MSIVTDRSIWDWAQRVAKEQNENSLDIAGLFVAAVISGELPSPPLNIQIRNQLRSLGIVEQIRSRKRLWIADSPQYAGFWLRQIVFPESDVRYWLKARPSSETQQSGTDNKEREFVQWMKDEKRQRGKYPPRDPPEKTTRKNWRAWAAENGVGRKTAESWVTKYHLSERRGAPIRN
jgi:hypothetical protein